jgi:23S rRNA (uracil1939-C5)-methyltransferase
VSFAERVDCPHADLCPGCPLIGLPLPAQLQAKAARVLRAFAPYASLRGVAPEAVRAASPVSGYRTRAKLVVAPGPRLGLFARGAGHEVLDLPGCRVLAPVLAGAAAALRALLAEPGAGPALRAEGDGAGRLRAVDLRELRDGDAAGVLVTLVLRAPAPPPAELAAAAERLAKTLPTLHGVAVSLHDGRSPQLLGSAPRPVHGAPLHRDRLEPGAPYVLVPPGAFAQAHRAQAAALQAELVRALGGLRDRRVLEVHSGSGALALALARAGARVLAVESFAPAAAAAERAAREQGLAGVEVRAGAAESWLPRLRKEGARFAIGVANPPRRGIPPDVREALAELCTDALAYVSCEPETLARDLAHLAGLGWGCARLATFDLMPQTEEVECVAWLRRAPPPPPAVLYEDALLLAVEKPPFLPGAPQAGSPGSLLERVRALAGAERAVALDRPDAEASGVCLFARRPEDAPALEAALADARSRRVHLALVRGVARARGRIARPGHEAGRTREAGIRYRRLAVAGGHALLAVAAAGPRVPPIRRLLAAVGEPVLGDERHGHPASNRHLFERHFLDRPFLHCASVELRQPQTGRWLRVEAPLAPDLAAVLARLGVDPTRIGVGGDAAA